MSASSVWQLLDRPAVFHAARFLLVGHQRATKQLLREHLAGGSEETVLDVCCGVGEFAEAVTGRYVGVDLNERFIRGARRRHAGDARKRFEVADVLQSHYPAGHFDKAMLVNSLHHFSDDEATRLLAELRRITRTLIVVVDADGTPRGLVRRLLLALDRGHFMRTPARLAEVVGRVLPIAQTVTFEVGLYGEVLLHCPLV
jgi:ubiquinone/menaquinone biosynthesis C-methylase UbiE